METHMAIQPPSPDRRELSDLAHLPDVIVDAHHHLWRLGDDGRYPWLQERYDPQAFFLGDYSAVCGDFGPEVYQARWAGLPLAATVHVEAERHPAESLAETGWLHRVNAVHGFPNAIVAHADFNAGDLARQLEAQRAFPLVRGIRCKPLTSPRADLSVHGKPGSLQDERWHLGEAADAIAMFPSLTVILEHAGLPWDRSEAGLAHWRLGMEALARLPNVTVKLSEFGLPTAPWNRADNVRVIREALGIFGWERCMFASNLPVSGLRAGLVDIVGTVADGLAGLDTQAARAVWSGNAVRVYGIDAEAAASPLTARRAGIATRKQSGDDNHETR
jgi:predicted TIM-barrel fold metal-dependent hydrolase